jgi:hypothetical protein
VDEGEAPLPVYPRNVFKAQKLERLWPSHSVLLPCDGREPSKEYAPSFLLGQLQSKLDEPILYLLVESVCIPLELKSCQKIVCETHQISFTPTRRFEFPLKPQVQKKVKIDVTQDGRYHSTYAKGNLQFERVVTGWRTQSVLDLRLKK